MIVALIALMLLGAIYALLIKGYLWKLIVLIAAFAFSYNYLANELHLEPLWAIGIPSLICILAMSYTKE